MGALTQKELCRSQPRLLAEELQPDILHESLRHYGARQTPAALFRSAWNHTEYALSRNVELSDDVRNAYFGYTQDIANAVLLHEGSNQDADIGALVLSTYVPAFRKRAFDLPLESEDCREIYRSLGYAISLFQPLDIDEPPQWRMTETAVLALSARTGQPDLLLYPTSPREETSEIQRFNHDSYFYDGDGKSKIPIQQKLIKTEKTYDEWITLLILQPLVKKGLKYSGMADTGLLSDQMNHLLSLVIAETTGEELTRSEKNFLDYLSQAVAAHRFTRRQSESADMVA